MQYYANGRIVIQTGIGSNTNRKIISALLYDYKELATLESHTNMQCFNGP